ncbi:ankyrin repeat-containing domain protein [Aspergillus lucknowensis]|uniref:Ankyrin repeat-containing domain protein n=1 Tax=Aspergillus lucknowensis TaxID=176173 RepID=A0ABR4LDI2_9EURO
MPLIDLPNELLHLISTSLEHERDINAFAKTNRHLYNLVNPHLYQVNAQYNDSSALIWAVRKQRSSTMELCLANRADPHATTTWVSWSIVDDVTPLFIAAGEDWEEGVRRLLLAQPEPEMTPDMYFLYGRTLLSWAAEYGSLNVVRYLVSRDNVDPHLKDGEGATPLWRAAAHCRAEVVRLLLATGRADVNVQFTEWDPDDDGGGQTPLMMACNRLIRVEYDGAETGAGAEDCNETLKLLLEYEFEHGQSDPYYRGNNYLEDSFRWVLSILLHRGPAEIVDLILRLSGLDCNTPVYEGRQLLSWAASYDSEGVVSVLIRHGAEIDLRDSVGRTPLSWAADGGQTRLVRYFLDAGAEVDPKDEKGITPVHSATCAGHDEVVKILRDRGAALPNLRVEDVPRYIWMRANDGKLPAIADLLRETGVDQALRERYPLPAKSAEEQEWCADGIFD